MKNKEILELLIILFTAFLGALLAYILCISGIPDYLYKMIHLLSTFL